MRIAVALVWYAALTSGQARAVESPIPRVEVSNRTEGVIIESTTPESNARWQPASPSKVPPLQQEASGWWISLDRWFGSLLQLLLR